MHFSSHHEAAPKALGLLELGLLLTGLVLCGWYATQRLSSYWGSKQALAAFASAQPRATLTGKEIGGGRIDFSLWSPGRLAAYQKSLNADVSSPIAVLKIPKIHLEVAVFDGTEDVVLDRGVGRIAGTSQPGELGNIGIAGHRDGFFRGLKDIGFGDTVELLTFEKNQIFRVDRTEIVDPSDVEVLKIADSPTLTLVTCYPFYHVGSAPQRFIAQAKLSSEELRANEK
jgi:sortase A